MNNYRLIVLGMHRSGTSCLTGLLQQAGLVLGDVVESAPHNKKGNRENLDIRALNDAVLAYSNSTWNLPPNRLSWNAQHERRRDQIIQQYSGLDIWGFKDPRTVFTLEFWLNGMHHDEILFISTFRNPLLVAKSLNKRDPNFSLENGLILWKHYNEKIIEYHEKYLFSVLNFDLDSYRYLLSFRAAIRHLENPFISPDCDLDFFEDTLRSHTTFNDEEIQRYKPILDQIMPTYERLELLSCNG